MTRYDDPTSRKLINENISNNYFVEAGAGSGKTTALVGRMVSLIKQGKKIEHICAITFTKAAANEFYERFQKELTKESDNELCKQALQNIDLAFMGTIDAFCNKIMSEHPNEGLIPSCSRVIDDLEADDLYKHEYTRIQNGLYHDEELERKGKRFSSFVYKPEEAFSYTLKALLSHNDCQYVIPDIKLENYDKKYAREKQAIVEIVKIVKELDPSSLRVNEKFFALLESRANIFEKSWENNISEILYVYDSFLKSIKIIKNDVITDKLGAYVNHFIESGSKPIYYVLDPEGLLKIFEEIKNEQYAVTLDFVNDAKDAIKAELRKKGFLTFSDYLVYLRDTLKKDAENGGKLIKHIYNNHKYYLIDEFQDTDPIQAEVFFYLSAKEINPDWKKCIPHPGSLFIVGDPKQSIYRFKNADVASYLNVEKMFENQEIGDVLHLDKNFRSTNKLKNFFNETFTRLFIEGDEQSSYAEIPIEEEKQQYSGIYMYQSTGKEDGQKVRSIIQRYMKDNTSYQVYDKDLKGNRPLQYKDFMVITSGKSALSKYTSELRAYNIPYFVEGSVMFGKCKALKEIVDFYGAVTNLNDNRFLYAILKSYLYGIKEKDIQEAINSGFPFNLNSSLEGFNISDELKTALEQLKEYAQKAKNLSPSSLYALIVEKINFFKHIDNENMEYIFFVLELLKDKENDHFIYDHFSALSFLLETIENSEEERCPSFKKSGNQVHLANLHKVKGLEAPIVILAGPQKGKKPISFRMDRSTEPHKGYMFNVPNSVISTNRYDKLKEAEKTSSELEDVRLKYVAATRARNALIISGLITNKGKAHGLGTWNMLFDLDDENNFRTQYDDIELMLSTISSQQQDKPFCNDNVNSENILEKKKEVLIESNYQLYNPSKQVEFNEDSDYDPRYSKYLGEYHGNEYSALIGTAVHRLLELIVISKDSYQKEELVDFVIKENISGDVTNIREMLLKVFDKMHNGGYQQKGKIQQDILPILLSADEIYSEVPFTFKQDEKLWNGIIDLIYKKDGKLHIIDWKTNKDDTNLDDHYKNQLNAYIQATQQLLHQDVEDALIYHIELK